MSKLLLIILFTISNSIVANADKIQDAYFISLVREIEQVVISYKETIKSILENKNFNPEKDCPELSKGGILFHQTLIIVNEIEVTPKIKELYSYYQILLRERRAMNSKLEKTCYANIITSKDDEHIESISKRIDLYSYKVSMEGNKLQDYISELDKVSVEDVNKFESEFLKRLEDSNLY